MFDADDDGVTVGELEAEHARGTAARVRARGGGDGRGGGATERTGDVRGAHELEDHGADQLAAARAVVLARAHEGRHPNPTRDRSTSRSALRAEDVSARLPKCASAAGLSDQPSGVRNAESASSPIPIAPAGARRPSRRRGPREGGCAKSRQTKTREGQFSRARALARLHRGKDVDVAHATRTPTGRERGSAQSTTSTTPRR